VVRRFRPDREGHLDGLAQRREHGCDGRGWSETEAQLLGKNAPEAVGCLGRLRGFVRAVSRTMIAVVRCRRRGPSVVSMHRGNRVHLGMIEVMNTGGRRRTIDRRCRTACSHQQGLQEKRAGRNESNDAAEVFPSDRPLNHRTRSTQSYPTSAWNPWPDAVRHLRRSSRYRRSLRQSPPSRALPDPCGRTLRLINCNAARQLQHSGSPYSQDARRRRGEAGAARMCGGMRRAILLISEESSLLKMSRCHPHPPLRGDLSRQGRGGEGNLPTARAIPAVSPHGSACAISATGFRPARENRACP
jgi:hypothetical protein